MSRYRKEGKIPLLYPYVFFVTTPIFPPSIPLSTIRTVPKTVEVRKIRKASNRLTKMTHTRLFWNVEFPSFVYWSGEFDCFIDSGEALSHRLIFNGSLTRLLMVKNLDSDMRVPVSTELSLSS